MLLKMPPPAQSEPKTLQFWMLSEDGVLNSPDTDNVDVEAEMRKRMAGTDGKLARRQEKELDRDIYGWWKNGGWFGEVDGSGDFTPDFDEDDTTSVCSVSSSAEVSSWETDEEEEGDDDDGRTTPTRENPYPRSRESSPSTDLTRNLSTLAQLLNPRSQAARQQAQLLSHHLQHPTPLTRSQYRLALQRERSQVLTSTRYRPRGIPNPPGQGPLTADDEAEILEHLILSRRAQQGAPRASSSQNRPEAWAEGAEGLGADGPQCVVCQTSPRTILVWPCRCLSLCEDCRVSLAMNNFGSCVCCRRDVLGFSRIYVP